MTNLPPPFDLLPPLLNGLWVTIQLTAGGALLAFVMAWLAGLGKLSAMAPIRWLAVAYVEIFRGTSALVQLFWFYFALPLLGVNMSAMTAGILVLGLNIGAYGAEVVRGAILAVPRGQTEAAVALNLAPIQRLWRVIAPQATLTMLPPAGNLLIELLKQTALVSLITLSDLTFEGMTLRSATFRTEEIFILLLVIYFILATILSSGVNLVERRMARSRG